MLNLTEFAKGVHAVAVEHGWWEGEENNDIDTKIALIHAEWSEALEEYRAGRPMVWHRSGYVGGKRTLPQLVAVLHYATAMSGAENDDASSWLNGCIEAVHEWLDDQGVDFEAVLRTKHEYNKTRSYRHGGKRC